MARVRSAARAEMPVPEPAEETYQPTREEIEARAYFRYLDRGQIDGSDVEDWLAAEEELRRGPEPLTHRA